MAVGGSFFKTRSLAKSAVEGGKVHLDGKRVKPSKELRSGQTLQIRRGDLVQTVVIKELCNNAAQRQKRRRFMQRRLRALSYANCEKAPNAWSERALEFPAQAGQKDRRALAQLRDLDKGWKQHPDI